MDPWNDRLSLMKTHNVQLLSAREKFPFEITPFMLHLTREADQGTATPGGASSNTPPPTQNPAPAASPQQGGNPSGQEQPVQNGQPAAR
jgi:hypothetical protein